MQIVIDISSGLCNWCDNNVLDGEDADILWKIIKNGTPLPKGHGQLGDLDKLKKDMQTYHDDCAATSEYTRLGFETAIAVVENAKPIIAADERESEK